MTTIMISSIVTEMDSTTRKRFVDIRPSAFNAYGTLCNFNAVATRVDGDLDGKAAQISEYGA